MPAYELAIMLRAMPKAELKTCLKRVSHAIFDRGGIIRNIENLGFRQMPYKTSSHGLVHREANYFIFKVDTASQAVADLKEEYSRDVDIIRQHVFKVPSDAENKCTLEQEMLPPAYREDVQKMIEIGKTQVNRFTHKFKYNSGLDYYPFQNVKHAFSKMSYLAVMHVIKSKFYNEINFVMHLFVNSRHKYHNDIEAAVNEQIKYEHQAAIDYLIMATNLLHPMVSYVGTGQFFMKMYKEELNHMEVLIKYQLTRGGIPLINIEKKKEETLKENLTLLTAFTKALKMESEITEKLQKIVSTAEALKDYHCVDFITSKFLDEQIHAIHELSHHVTVLNKLCDSEHALWLYDKELLKSCPHSPKK